MSKTKANRPKARLPKGFADRSAGEIRRVAAMTDTIRRVYEAWGFEPVETPLVEYADALGKFLPDEDRPNEGVFAFRDDDEEWLSLRYDLTAPLARYVAENFERLPKPHKSYRAGWVFRNEKPGAGRFRQFMQFDADIVGAGSPLADAQICMMAADTMEALGFSRGEYVIRVNSRRVLDAVMDAIEIPAPDVSNQRLAVLRAVDKADKFDISEIRKLLGPGRKDESGDFTPGAGLSDDQAAAIIELLERPIPSRSGSRASGEAIPADADFLLAHPDTPVTDEDTFSHARWRLRDFNADPSALGELEEIAAACRAADYGTRRVQIDFSVVRGLEYYTGAVFEAELTMRPDDPAGNPVRFGSVGGGGRYDGLVGRFRGEDVPATGFSVGVSRLAAALEARSDTPPEKGPVVVTVMDRARVGESQMMTASLRAALATAGRDGGPVPVEMYVGDGGLKAQLRYADRRNAPCVVIQGEDERAAGKVQIKDLAAGKRAAAEIESREDWVSARPAQVEVDDTPEAIAAAVRTLLNQ